MNSSEQDGKFLDVEFCPPSELLKRKIDLTKAQKFALKDLAAIGVAFEPIMQIESFLKGAGQSGLYFVDTLGKAMFKKDNKFIGALKADNGAVGGGIVRLTQLPIDPTMLCMAVTFMSIEGKLDAICETQKEILNFLEMKEEARLKGNLNALVDILNNYRFNWDNEKYKSNKHILVQDIRCETQQSIVFSKDNLEKMLQKKAILTSEKELRSALEKNIAKLNDYQLALYIFSFSSFLEVMLLENFDKDYLNSTSDKIKEYANDYKALLEKCSKKLESDSKSTLKGYTIKGLSKLSSGAGGIAGKIPVLNKSPLSEKLLSAGKHLEDIGEARTQNALQLLAGSQTDYTHSFTESIKALEALFNQPTQLFFDLESIYIINKAVVA